MGVKRNVRMNEVEQSKISYNLRQKSWAFGTLQFKYTMKIYSLTIIIVLYKVRQTLDGFWLDTCYSLYHGTILWLLNFVLEYKVFYLGGILRFDRVC